MEPTLAKKLMTGSKDVQKFVVFISKEIKKLDTLDEIETDDPIKVAIEIKARKLAFNKLKDILEPLLDISEDKVKFNGKEYVV